MVFSSFEMLEFYIKRYFLQEGLKKKQKEFIVNNQNTSLPLISCL